MICDWEVAVERVVKRSASLEDGALEINEEAMQVFRERFDEVDDSEGFEVVEVDCS